VGQVSRVVADAGAGVTVSSRTPDAVADGIGWVLGQPAGSLREASIAAAAPYLADRVLEELYAYNRELATRRGEGRRD
jgi:hypothetical protein